MSAPGITVLMPVYNCGPFLREAVDSILGQTFEDFELLAIDDGSTDDSGRILQEYAARDQRVRLEPNETNLGLIRTLNKGLDLAHGGYIVRMDGDDVSTPDRLARLAAFLDSNPDVDICGSSLRLFDSGADEVWTYPAGDDAIKGLLIFHPSMPHATAAFRRAAFERHGLRYDPDYIHAEDYQLWVTAAPYVHFAVLGEVLYLYRMHPGNVHTASREAMLATTNRIRREQIEALGINVDEERFVLHRALSEDDLRADLEFVARAEAWLLELSAANEVQKNYPVEAFAQAMRNKWRAVCAASSGLGLPVYRRYIRSPLCRNPKPSLRARASMALRCLARR